MRRLLVLAVLLVMVLAVASCGGESQRSEEASPPEQGRTAPAAQGAATGGAPVQETREEDGEAGGLSVTTLEGEEVTVGGQGSVTALYFMAGW